MTNFPKSVKLALCFKKDLKRIKKRGYDIDELLKVVNAISRNKPLVETNKEHLLLGNYQGYFECHVMSRTSDWILIYQKIVVSPDQCIVYLFRTGTHADCFE